MVLVYVPRRCKVVVVDALFITVLLAACWISIGLQLLLKYLLVNSSGCFVEKGRVHSGFNGRFNS